MTLLKKLSKIFYSAALVATVGATFSATAQIIPSVPQINAKGYYLVDFTTGKVIAQGNGDEKLAPASLTKMMTSYVIGSEVKNGKINGINVTVPFKKSVIPFLDQLTLIAKEAQSVNTIFKKDNKIVGDNTDIGGFEYGLKHINYDVKNKKVFILGAGGVVPSIILALKKLGVFKISLSNRTKEKAVELKKIYKDLEVINWGECIDFDMIINATSLGLKNDDRIELDFGKIKSDKLFYDVIYNPSKTNFLLKGEE